MRAEDSFRQPLADTSLGEGGRRKERRYFI
nr:MAG TPA: hypothetical protein [Caudoviricetes sp.]